MSALRDRLRAFTLTPRQYLYVAYAGLGAFTLIVMSGAAVRLTGSGLGCPDWPRCYGHDYPPLNSHAVIEFSNRTITVPVTLIAIAAWALAFRRRPYRRDLVWISLLLPLGVVAQAVLGGLTVEGKLAYGWVMGHFALSILLILAAWTLVWHASHEPDELAGKDVRPDRLLLWGARVLVFMGALTIFAGSAATAAGPHAGGEPGQRISRLGFDGRGTMDFVIHRHSEIAAVFGLLAIFLWVLARERGASAEVRRASTLTCVLLGVQGVVGAVQYETHLPTELVWVHVALACFVWIAALWTHSAMTVSPAPAVPQPAVGSARSAGLGAGVSAGAGPGVGAGAGASPLARDPVALVARESAITSPQAPASP
jgi:cytochrome c oxidase assembly protein subunit 15